MLGNNNFFNKIKISSGYLNLHQFIINLLKKSTYDVDIVTSSPKANGFYKAGFFKKHVPHFYRRYEQILLQSTKKSNKQNLSLYEFTRENWTFHSKGIWFYEKDKDYPTLTAIGSSNYSNNNK